MSYQDDNIFAKILREELPCIKVYEDDTTLVFMDIMPQGDGHTLVIPKEAAVDLIELSGAGAADLINKVQLVAAAVKKGMEADGITIFQLNGAAAGQTVPHVHFHILPGSFLQAKTHADTLAQRDPAQLEIFAEKIRAAF